MSNLPKIGIDIGSATIKVVELAPVSKGRWKLLAAASSVVPVGGVMAGASNQAAITNAIVKILREAGVRSRKAIVALPEDQISSHVVEMPVMSEAEVEQALQWQVEQYIPIPADQAVWSYQIIRRELPGNGGGGMEVLLAAAARRMVETYRQVVEQAGLEVVAMETELMATARAVVPEATPPSLIVDVGAKSTDVGVIVGGQLVFARTIPTAGQAFTRAIETTLGLDTKQAEQYKNTYGFSATQLQGKLTAAMKPVMMVIASEIKKTIDFYVSKHAGEVIRMVILSGGIAALPDIVGALSELLGLEVTVGNPFLRVAVDQMQARQLADGGPFYAVSIGLSMREI
ncbi:hypothetical protein A2634_03620 [Candidatus Amesbacteria bacterium RIFCSPHIGHO2_01_FULL_48_32]|uniref:SHS2 domain-containing protein n=1 Tax=Candidatus Amesbacteria bacterium RIFCSPLOWO2_01_FULL_48_25 TaxID=1797259 RepID=A0A1F4ZDF6_9BACT|nr:MAG: hypothetical protein A2634_03620 [Candidatus Amesbacteria bacterium RIFCSPHIGHO2_01_FULL_48_32]OGD03767.1 MAG: hypothetical protein A2989_03740 [Candidatus Amesbacteria bacterium RIFCSPLOWO2_01_FULL_48_25]HJZ05126.1 type IV pilus assembly protein PilM [Patescibacteria group bacterium]